MSKACYPLKSLTLDHIPSVLPDTSGSILSFCEIKQKTGHGFFTSYIICIPNLINMTATM